MIKIKRDINGEAVDLTLTREEEEEVINQKKIQFAKDILANYEDRIVDYDKAMADGDKLLAFADLLINKCLDENSNEEEEVLEEIFETTEDY